MIGKYMLEELLKEYNINSETLINKNNNVLGYGEYLEIKNTLDYLIGELKINSKNIEKCPSILYYNVDVLKKI